jgi:hypothetical protein
MTLQNPMLFEDLPGYTPHISRLLAMMHYVRETTLHAAKGLTVAQLDYLVHPQGNSIGMLLAHIAAVEEGYYLETVAGQEVDWETPALTLGKAGRRALRGRPLEHYLNELGRVRAQTLNGFLTCDDAWLHAEDMAWDTPANNYFRWFHVFEDEINHRGQMRLIRRLLPAGV